MALLARDHPRLARQLPEQVGVRVVVPRRSRSRRGRGGAAARRSRRSGRCPRTRTGTAAPPCARAAAGRRQVGHAARDARAPPLALCAAPAAGTIPARNETRSWARRARLGTLRAVSRSSPSAPSTAPATPQPAASDRQRAAISRRRRWTTGRGERYSAAPWVRGRPAIVRRHADERHRHRGHEVRRHLGGRRRAHQARGAAHRAARRGGRPRGGRALRARASTPTSWWRWPTRSPTARTRARWTCCSPPGERVSCALAAMVINDLGHEAISLTGSQAGIVTDTAPHEGAHPRGEGATASARRSTTAGSCSWRASRACRRSRST